MIRKLKKLAAWLILPACLLLGAAGPARAADDILGPGDSIHITVFENPDLTTDARVSARGNIRFPLLGDIQIGGLTPTAAGERIATLLREGKFIRNPQVTVATVQVRSRQVSVLGQVARPGRYALDETATSLTDMLAMAGGIIPTGDDVVTLVRTRNGKTEKRDIDVPGMVRAGDMASNIEVENGDTIFVRRAPVFYIYGEVQKAGPYRLENDLTVLQAISVGGGLTMRGTERGIKVSRRGPDGKVVKQEVPLSETVRADDIIHVQESLF